MKLIALYPILYQSKQYQIGEELPTNNPDMVEAWTEANTASWMEEKSKSVKAIPATAQAGIAGVAVNSETDDNLVGIVPMGRKKK